jgi:hypothetical protein
MVSLWAGDSGFVLYVEFSERTQASPIECYYFRLAYVFCYPYSSKALHEANAETLATYCASRDADSKMLSTCLSH